MADGTVGHGLGRRAPGSLAGAVLDILLRADRALTPAEVRDELADLSYSTVVTILTRLYAKGVVSRERSAGRAFAYRPVADESGLAARRMHQVLAGEVDREAVLTRFVSDLSAADEQVLRELLGEG